MSCSTPVPSLQQPSEASCAVGHSTEKDGFDRAVEEVREIDVGQWSRVGKHILTSFRSCDAIADDEQVVVAEEIPSSSVSADCRALQQHAPEGEQLTDASTDEEADESAEEDDDALSESSGSSRITSSSASVSHHEHVIEDPAQDNAGAAPRRHGRPDEAETAQEWRTQLRGRSWADIDEEDDEEREPPRMLLIPRRLRSQSRARIAAVHPRHELVENDIDDTDDEMWVPDDLDEIVEARMHSRGQIYPSMHRPEAEPEEEEAPPFEEEYLGSADEAEPEPEDCEEEPEAELI